MRTKYDVLGIGISAVDDIFYISDYPPANCKIPIGSSARCGGGPACTAIAAIGALQGQASFVARLGADELSEYIKRELSRLDVDTLDIIEDQTGAPYHSIIIVDAAGNRMVLYDSSHYRPIAAEDVSESLLQSSSIVLLDYLSEPAAIEIAEKARRLGVSTLGDIEGRSESALQLSKLIDYLIVPEDFAVWATGEPRLEDACASLARSERRATIVTNGANGCYLRTKENATIVHFPAFAIDVFDTTGCGDVFHGAFGLASARGANVADAIVFASAAAALKAHASGGQKHGWEALPQLESVFSFLQSRLTELNKSALLTRLEPLRTKDAVRS